MKKGTIKLMTMFALGLMVFASCGPSEADLNKAKEDAAKQLEEMNSSVTANEEWSCPENCENGKTYISGGNCPECYGVLVLAE